MMNSTIPDRVRYWEALRADCRRQESEAEFALSELDAIARQVSADGKLRSEGPSGAGSVGEASSGSADVQGFQRRAHEAQAAIAKLQTLVHSMADVSRELSNASAGGGAPPGIDLQSIEMQTNRFEELATEKAQMLKQATREYKARRDKLNLFANPHSTVTIQRESEGVRHLVNERESLMHSRAHVRQLLQISEANRDALDRQKQRILKAADSVTTIVERMPFVSNVLNAIESRRRRQAVILGAVVVFCVLVILWFW